MELIELLQRVQQSYREICESNTTDTEIEKSRIKTIEVKNNEQTLDKDTGLDDQENNDMEGEIAEKNSNDAKENNNGSSEDRNEEDRRAHMSTVEVNSDEELKSNPSQGTRTKRRSPIRRATTLRQIGSSIMCENTNVSLRTISECVSSEGLEAMYKIGDNTLEITVNIDKQLIGNRKIVVNVVAGKEKKAYDLPDAQERKTVVQKDRTSIFGRKVEARNRIEGKGGMGEALEKEGCRVRKESVEMTSPDTDKWKPENNNPQGERQQHTDIYGRKQPQMSEWYSITKEDTRTAPVPWTIRHINPQDKRRFIDVLKKVETRSRMNAWLNLTRCLEGKEKWIWGIGEFPDSKSVDKRYLAISQFYKGGYGKARLTLMGDVTDEIKLRKNDIVTLFPACEEERQLPTVGVKNLERKLICKDDVRQVLKSLPNGKAVGMTGLSYEVIKGICKNGEALEMVTSVYNEMLEHPEVVPKQYYRAKVVGIPKANGGVRPLCVQECFAKVLNKMLARKITEIVRDKIDNIQKCLSKSDGQMLARGKVLREIESGGKCVIQFDYRNAFGTTSRREIVKRLAYYNIESTIINYIIVLLNNQTLVYEGETGFETVHPETGVPQGEPLSMVLFSLGIDSLVQEYDSREGVHVTAYADDIVMVMDKLDEAKSVKEEFEKDAMRIGLHLNKAKTKIGFPVEVEEGLKCEIADGGETIVDLRKDKMMYIGLPVTTSKTVEAEHVLEKIEEYVGKSKKLWEARVPLQMKYYLQRLCLDPELDFTFKGTPKAIVVDKVRIKELQGELDKSWKEITEIVPKPYRRLPIKYYGIGMMSLKDRMSVVRDLYDTRVRGEQRDVVLEHYLHLVDKWSKKGCIPPLDITAIPLKANVSLSSPPSSPAYRLSDGAFRMLMMLRYNSDAADGMLEGTDKRRPCVCKYHTSRKLTLQHVITCPFLGGGSTIEQHDRICKVIGALLLKNKNVTDVLRETYSERQRRERESGARGKRADITYKSKGITHSIDVKVSSSNNSSRVNNITDAWNRKQRQYKGEENLHIVMFDTAGNIADESWRFLLSIGSTVADLRIMQRIIFECMNARVSRIIEDKKRANYRRRLEWYGGKVQG